MSTSFPNTPDSVLAMIAELQECSIKQLRQEWRRLFNTAPPANTKNNLLIRRIAYELQCRALPKHLQTIKNDNAERIAAIQQELKQPKQSNKVQLAPGVVLTRTHQGVDHQVTVTSTGEYAYDGKLYDNLSVIAREITGTRWSGPAFFGVKKPKEKTA